MADRRVHRQSRLTASSGPSQGGGSQGKIILFLNFFLPTQDLIEIVSQQLVKDCNPGVPKSTKDPNYVDWKRNLDIVLTSEGFKYVLVEECPIKLVDDTDVEIKTYDKRVDEMARCYILASIANVLQHHHQSLKSAYDMLKSPKEMFGEQNRVAKKTAMKALLTTKIVEGSPVKDHVLNMMSYLNELEILGVASDKDSQV
ncbi:hypothetical protein KY285_005172 [Solanum tuberosum]|nr:hypothetical protein KY284_005400 [Solanum tuberosum]KAH0752024.1 hypothetical protein KY285_005172 [Solanum tuberosum]